MARFIETTMAFMAAVLAIANSCPAMGQQIAVDNRPKITVSGESVVYVQPDKILISLGVETRDAEIDVAKRKNDEIVHKVIAAVQECGLDKKAIQTDQLSIEPTYETRSGWPQTIRSYEVQNALVVTLSDVTMLDRLITGALKAGANRVHNVDFQTTKLREYRDQARRLALKAAREKAADMAAVYGQTIGKPLQIDENPGDGGPFYQYWSWCGWGGERDYGTSNSSVNAPANPGVKMDTVALGKIAVRANVNVVFELKDK